MAFQTRGRDPLLDSDMQAAVEKRGKELFGFLLVLLGLAVAAMIVSYTPEDPNWYVSTDTPARNWMGSFGASIAHILYLGLGYGAWAIVVPPVVWGARFLLHRGEERAVPWLLISLLLPIVLAIYMSTLPPGAAWSQEHNSGLGGLMGDFFLAMLLLLLPIAPIVGVKLLSLTLAVALFFLSAFSLGFTRSELGRFARFLVVGVIMTYGTLASLVGRGASSGVAAAKAAKERRQERLLEEQQLASDEMASADSLIDDEPYVDEEPSVPAKTGLFARVPNLIRRSEPEEDVLVETDDELEEFDELPGEDRISAKIAKAVQVRRAADVPPEEDPNLPLTKGRGKRPEPLIFNPAADFDTGRAEPPVTAGLSVPEAPEEYTFTAEDPVDEYIQDAPVAEAYEDDEPFEDPISEPAPRVSAPIVELPKAEERKPVVQKTIHKAAAQSVRAKAEAEPRLAFDSSDSDFELPPLNLLTNPTNIERHVLSDEALEENARMLESVLDDYGVKGEIVSVRPGPVVTMYELEPAPGLKASRVIGLADDIARSMSALSARVSTVPGRSVIGIELPNEHREMVSFREILSSRDYGDGNQALPLALGKDIGGGAVVANLAKMPHLLIAGTTGSGKSVAINTMILSLLYKLSPDDCRLIMIDPKMLELSVYDGIPHLLSPVVTDPKKAVVALKWVVGEMEDRYRKMSKMGVRNIAGYNGRVEDALSKGELFSRTVQTGFDDDTGEPVFETEEFEPKKLPYIVVIVDEMADLMMVAGKEIEACIQRLAQMARASGIHLVMATQRPSVDVITGTIKANFPTRISFQVTSKVDSRTILGEMGAEQLLGMGDMLYMAGGSKITRCHGPFVSDEEVEEVVNHLKQFGPPDYVGGVVEGPDDEKAGNIDAVLGLNTGGNTGGEDALYDQAVAIVIKDRKCSTSYIQRKLAIGYNKAARLVEQMEDNGLVTPANHVGKREILVPEQEV
ncbi:DNA translocase FtsK [Epibacterium sp. SM1969]|uniref:DNA translocase FtsK n=1 Tax=Tritonibacter aquimaris TaxID=2663379 RepID=A0A844ATQ5_9RHOB|nr:DNA translocase FtsK [Tritonibacter aquimaris]MQY41774.1 DNA translocase FtsK [Tritonibacter aquimaris]